MIIDDEKDFSFFVKANLEFTRNYKVIVAESGRKGIWAALWQRPDLILLDIMMPGIDGFEVLKKLKVSKRTMFIPVIMLTAKNDDEAKAKATGLFNEDYVVKPVKIEDLISKIESVLKRI